jgi:hypothetical protein
MSDRLTSALLPLRSGDTPARQLSTPVARLAQHLQPTDWVLVGGQIVALHCHIAGDTPGRATIDIDIVANVLVNPNALSACRNAATALDLEPQRSPSNRCERRSQFSASAHISWRSFVIHIETPQTC